MGAKNVKIIRTGLFYNLAPTSTSPIPFSIEIDENYFETWRNGARMYHNPNALYPVDKKDFLDIAHFELDKKNRLLGYIPENFPFVSKTLAIEIKSEKDL